MNIPSISPVSDCTALIDLQRHAHKEVKEAVESGNPVNGPEKAQASVEQMNQVVKDDADASSPSSQVPGVSLNAVA